MWECRGQTKDMGNRPISIIQSNCFAFKNPVTGNNSYCDWPKVLQSFMRILN